MPSPLCFPTVTSCCIYRQRGDDVFSKWLQYYATTECMLAIICCFTLHYWSLSEGHLTWRWIFSWGKETGSDGHLRASYSTTGDSPPMFFYIVKLSECKNATNKPTCSKLIASSPLNMYKYECCTIKMWGNVLLWVDICTCVLVCVCACVRAYVLCVCVYETSTLLQKCKCKHAYTCNLQQLTNFFFPSVCRESQTGY